MQKLKTHWKEILVGLLVLANLFVWSVIFAETRGGVLTVSILDVGQGDSIFIEGPSGIQILVDGGKDKKVLSQLGEVMPFYDRSIDVVVGTHPDFDHVGGLLEVVRRYNTLLYIEPGVVTDKPFDAEIHNELARQGVQVLKGRVGMRIPLGRGAYFTILFPDVDVAGFETNTASIVALVEYGKTSFILTGDSPQKIENYLVGKMGGALNIDVLKVGHHGSRTSSSEYFLAATSPAYAVISAGKDNSYGHPHKEVSDKLRSIGAEIINTADVERVVFESDGVLLNRLE